MRPPEMIRPVWSLRAMLGRAVLAGALAAGPAASGAAAQAGDVELRADGLYREGKHHESLALLERHLEGVPRDYLALVLAARDELVLGYSATDADSARAWLRRSIAHGSAAQEIDPTDAAGRYVTLAAKGRLALVEGSRARARLGVEVEREALALLAEDSLHAGAHNALGRVYLEVARLSRVERVFARAIMGSTVGRARWDAAEAHLRRAVALQPERNFHHVDLGALLVARGRRDEARAVLDEALRVPLEIPAQEGFRRDARWLLRQADPGR